MMNEATDLSMGDSGAQGNSLKRTHAAAGLPSTSEMRQGFLQRQAYSDDDLDSCDGSLGGRPSTPGPKPGKKTRGRVKINMEFIDNKLRRYTTFSKRKSGIMKKAHELATLTGTQVMLLVASETGHVYTFATRKLQPILSSEAGKQLIQTCLNSPDTAESQVTQNNYDQQRMSAQGFEEPDLSYAPPEESKEVLLQKTYHNMLTAMSHGGSSDMQSGSPVMEIRERATESPMNLIAVNSTNSNSPRGQVSAVQLPGGAYIMSGATQADTRTIQLSHDNQAVRSSVTNSTGILPQQTLLTQSTTLVPDRLNDGQLALLNSYGSLAQRQVPGMQQVLWAPTALHPQSIALMHPSQITEDKSESKG